MAKARIRGARKWRHITYPAPAPPPAPAARPVARDLLTGAPLDPAAQHLPVNWYPPTYAHEPHRRSPHTEHYASRHLTHD